MAQTAVSGIYEIVNLENGKRYIGSAVNFRVRFGAHRHLLRRGKHHSSVLQRAWIKYGEAKFIFQKILVCRPADLLLYEQAAFQAFKPEYNICHVAASHRGMKRSEETRAKIAARAIGRKLSQPRSDEYRAKISAAHAGKSKSSEHMSALQTGRARRIFTQQDKENLSAALKAQYENGTRNRARPTEYREKISQTLKGRRLSDAHRANVSAAMRGKRRGPYKKRCEADNEPGIFDF